MAGLIPERGAGGSTDPHLQLEGIGKSFGTLRALDGVDLRIAAGTVHALIGENGAGKSTLGKIISGVIAPDAGVIRVHGDAVSMADPRAALGHGIAVIAQELTVVKALSVADNVLLGQEPRRAGIVDRRGIRQRFEQLAEETGFDLDGRTLAGSLRVAERQQVEILRALASGAQLVVMDEPTASLSGRETEQLHGIIRRLTGSGRTVVLVSHFLGEILELADDVTILRDGRLVRTGPIAAETKDSLILGMLGRPLSAAYPDKRYAPEDANVVLSVEGLSAPGVSDASFEVRAGEIVGIAGLVGSGRTELVRAIAGATRRQRGEVLVAGEAAGPSLASSRQAGVVLISESRKDEGLIPARSVVENITVASLGSFSRGGVVARRRERTAALDLMGRVSVRPDAALLPISSLSGGNQQKVLLARAMHCHPRVLIADEPTKGVDVGARRAIYDILSSLAESGAAVLFVSSELEEVVEVAHRAVVMRRGRIAAQLGRHDLTEQQILAAAFNDDDNDAGPSPAAQTSGVPR